MTNTNNKVKLPPHLVELAKKMEQSGFMMRFPASAEDAKKIRARIA